MNIDEIKNSQ
jgi:hypothetical protein